MGDDGIPGRDRNGRRELDNLNVRRAKASRQYMHRGFGSVGRGARTFDRLVNDQVVPQMKRLQREACRKQTQHRCLGESWDHGPHWASLKSPTLHSTSTPGKYATEVYQFD